MVCQDAHTIVLDMEQLTGFSFFGVFDGHGGSFVSQHAYVGTAHGVTRWWRHNQRVGPLNGLRHVVPK